MEIITTVYSMNTVSDISNVKLHLNADTENLNRDIRTWNHIYTP